MDYNGSAVMAMVGKNCVAIAADRRFGVQALTLGTDFQKIFPVNDKLYIGLSGLATDVETLYLTNSPQPRALPLQGQHVQARRRQGNRSQNICPHGLIYPLRKEVHSNLTQIRSVLCQPRHRWPR